MTLSDTPTNVVVIHAMHILLLVAPVRQFILQFYTNVYNDILIISKNL